MDKDLQNKGIKRILFVGWYPNNIEKYKNVFFQNLIFSIADSGIECTVISPVSYVRYRNKISLIPKEEYQNMTAQELVHAGREKMNKQDERLDDITKDVKKGRVGIKEFDNQVKEQNKLIEQVNEDMDRVDSRMNKLSKRMLDYIGKSNICYLIIFFLLDAAVFGLLVWVLTKIRRGFKWSS